MYVCVNLGAPVHVWVKKKICQIKMTTTEVEVEAETTTAECTGFRHRKWKSQPRYRTYILTHKYIEMVKRNTITRVKWKEDKYEMQKENEGNKLHTPSASEWENTKVYEKWVKTEKP